MNRSSKGADLAARAFLTVASLLPYWRLLTFGVVYVTDDYFASDIFNGELGGRVLIGRMLRSGHLPVWTSSLCSGVPLTGGALHPLPGARRSRPSGRRLRSMHGWSYCSSSPPTGRTIARDASAPTGRDRCSPASPMRSEEHTSELQSHSFTSY